MKKNKKFKKNFIKIFLTYLSLCFSLLIFFSCSLENSATTSGKAEISLEGITNYQNVINFHEFVFYDNKLKISMERETPVNLTIEALLTLRLNNEVTDVTNFRETLNSPIKISEIEINRIADEVEIKNVYLNNRKYSVSKTFPIQIDFLNKKETIHNVISSNEMIVYKFFSNNIVNNIGDILITDWLATNITFITNYKDISIMERKTIDKKILFTNFVTVNYVDKSGEKIYNNAFSNYYEKIHYFTNQRVNFRNNNFNYEYFSTNVGTVSNIAGAEKNIAITKGIIVQRNLFYTNHWTYNVFPVYQTNQSSNYYEVRQIYDGAVVQKADVNKTNIVFNGIQLRDKRLANGNLLQTNFHSYNRNIFFTNHISLKRISGSLSYAPLIASISSGGSVSVDKSAILPSAAQNSAYRYSLKSGSPVFPSGISINATTGQITVSGGSKSSNTYTITATIQSNDNKYTGTIEGQVSINIHKSFKLLASDKGGGDLFGYSVAIEGNTMVVGAYKEDYNDKGAVYVYTKSGNTWSESQKLLASDKVGGDEFGRSVAIEGNTIVVGAHYENSDGKSNNGAVYVFTKSGNTWSQSQKLLASDKDSSDWFGRSVAIEGNTMVVGANGEDSDGKTRNGAVYVYTKSGNTWSESQKLLASDKDSDDWFGDSVAIEGNTMVVGALYEDSVGKNNNGAVYVFTNNNNTWSESQKLLASDKDGGDLFGSSVAIEGNTMVVGAYGEDSDGKNSNGAVYVFTNNNNTWSQSQKLLASDKDSYDFFGYSVAIEGNTMVVGAYGEDSDGKNSNGAVYVYE